MTDRPRELDSATLDAVSHSRRGRTAHLLAEAEQVWPPRLPKREIGRLPPSVSDLLRPGRHSGPLRRAAQGLDHRLPGWVELAAAAVSEVATHLPPAHQRLCALLARRPLLHPEPLLRSLAAARGEARFWLLVALSGTDTPAVRAEWLHHLRAWALAERPPHRALWFAFAWACQRGWLSWPDFRDCLVRGRLLSFVTGPDGYQPALAALGLWSHPTFAKWHHQVVYEVANQPDAPLSLRETGWIKAFPDADYLWSALDELERKPDLWWPLYVLRWASVSADDPAALDQLSRYSSPVLCLLSLVRPDLSPRAGDALGSSHHADVVAWLTSAGPAAPLDPAWAKGALADWTAAYGEALTLAAGAVCALEPPPDYHPTEHRVPRQRAFIREHLIPDFDRLMDNLLYVQALRKCHFPMICEEARRGVPAALRSFALWPEQAEQAAPILFRLTREGNRASREAARQALDLLGQHVGVADLARLERRVDLASAWSDAGLEGKPARAWWDVGGYHLRLAVMGGEVRLEAYSGARRLASLPAAVRRDPQYPDIRQARADLARSYRYFRGRFERAMVAGDAYSGRDFAVLLANPVVRSLVSRLVLAVDGEPFLWSPEEPLGDCSPPAELTAARSVSIAHPVGLLGAGALDAWQQRVIEGRIAQPFKQVFREVYLLADREREADACPRFSGQPLAARRAFALLRARGYTPGVGDAVREYPQHRLRSHLHWAAPGEDAGKQLGLGDEAEPVTSGPVWFEADGRGRVRLGLVPPVVFSEALRDADLLVSRAAAGELGFTSEETRRLRATLVRYLARALGLTTIYVSEDDAHAIVEGQRAMYRVHLGSGSVLLEKSRLNLDLGDLRSGPMEDLVAESIDSLTARIIGIIGALAQDSQITDPRFLQQLGVRLQPQ